MRRPGEVIRDQEEEDWSTSAGYERAGVRIARGVTLVGTTCRVFIRLACSGGLGTRRRDDVNPTELVRAWCLACWMRSCARRRVEKWMRCNVGPDDQGSNGACPSEACSGDGAVICCCHCRLVKAMTSLADAVGSCDNGMLSVAHEPPLHALERLMREDTCADRNGPPGAPG